MMKKTISMILFLLILSPIIYGQEITNPEVILDRHAKAIGGMEAIKKFKSMHYEADVKLGTLKGTAELYLDKTWMTEMGVGEGPTTREVHIDYPANAIMKMDISVMKIEEGVFNGEYWIKDQTGTVRNMVGEERKQFVTDMLIGTYEYLLDPNLRESFEFLGEEEFDDRPCYAMNFLPYEGEPILLYFDAESYLMVGSKSTVQGIPVTSTYSDWRKADGLETPFVTVQDLGNPLLLTTITITGINVNEEIPEVVFVPPASGSKQYRFADSLDSTSLKFTLNVHHIYIPVYVNGEGPFMFLLDSGAGMTMINKSLADSIGLKDAGNLPAVGVGGIDVGNFVKIDSLRLGRLTLLDFAAGALDLGFAEQMLIEPIDGILGYDLFSRLIVDIDYPDEILSVYDPEAGIYKGGADTVTCEIETNHPVVEAYVNDTVPGRFRFDTGSQNFLDLNTPFVEEHDLLSHVVRELGKFPMLGIGGTSETTLAILKSFKIGDISLDNVITGFSNVETGIFAAENIDGNVGGGILKLFDIGFDYPNNRIYLTKPPGAEIDQGLVTTGIIVDEKDGNFNVFRILNGTPAEESGLKNGDRIVAINGVAVEGKKMQEVYDLLHGQEGDTITVQVDRDGKKYEYNLALENLFDTKTKDGNGE
jgi:hypothetical protein